MARRARGDVAVTACTLSAAVAVAVVAVRSARPAARLELLAAAVDDDEVAALDGRPQELKGRGAEVGGVVGRPQGAEHEAEGLVLQLLPRV